MASPVPTVLLIGVLLAVVSVPLRGEAGLAGRNVVASDRAAGGAIPISAPPLPPATPIQITVVLRPNDYAGLLQLDRSLGASSAHATTSYLSEQQFRDRFAPDPRAVSDVERYFGGFGVHGFVPLGDRLGIQFVGPAASVGSALGTHFVTTGTFGSHLRYAVREAPTLPSSLAGEVVGIGGLSNVGPAHLALHASSLLDGPRLVGSRVTNFVVNPGSGDQWFLGSDYTQLLNVSSEFPGSPGVANATFATHEAVATLLMSGFNDTTQQNLPPFDPVAVEQYFNDTFPSAWPHPTIVGVPVAIAGVAPPAPGYYNGSSDTTLDEEENSLDLEMAGSMAPGATIVNFYFAASLYDAASSNASVGTLADDFGTALGTALDHNYAGARLAAVTNSYGLPDLNDSLWNLELLHAQAIGVTVVAASGDQGNAPNEVSGRFQGQWPTWPATVAFNTSGTIAVGGVSLGAGGPSEGTFDGTNLTAGFDRNMTGVTSRSAWYETRAGFGNISGSEGGVSAVTPEPNWQFRSAAQPTIANVSAVQGVSVLGRAEPDLAFPANATVAYVARDAAGVYFDVLEGTSVASPIFAGMLAEMAAVAGHPFGYLDPELYRIASYFGAHPGAADPFVDVTVGANFVFAALPGWDGTTGWGLLDPAKFLAADANASVRDYRYAGPSPGIPPHPPLFTIGHHPPGTLLPLVTLIIIGLLGAVVVVLAIVVGRRPASAPPPPYPAYGTYLPPPPGATGGYAPPPPTTNPFPPGIWTFACPYCGRIRPAEPIPCPACGRL
ncbi:MAG: S8 family serine peptidase [Thermoplasmata archaeon]|nr:S8 family serine peptidase [Thermoplasmata archaeon]